MLNQLKTFRFLDPLGIIVSSACALHCAITPLVISFLPLINFSFLENELAEWFFVGLSIMIGTISLLVSHFLLHKQLKPIMIFLVGIILILIARLFFEENLFIELPTVLLGGFSIAGAHLINRKLCQNCLSCQDKRLT
jgi:intracellular septation protein A